MHESVRDFIAQHASHMQAPVLIVGSYNVNGSIREFLPHPNLAWGVDIVAGPEVDEVYDGVHLPACPNTDRDGTWGGVVCTEVFEHVKNPVAMAEEIVRVCQPDGVILVTARAPGFAYHNPPDRVRFMPGALSEMFSDAGCKCWETPDAQAPGVFVKAIKAS